MGIPEAIAGLFKRQEQATTLPKEIEKFVKPSFTDLIIQHEGLVPFQTPFRITSDDMAKWVSMFDDTIGIQLDPNFKKPKDRQNFLFLKNKDDVFPAVQEQFRRFSERQPGITVEDAVRIFDQTGADGKLNFLKQHGIKGDAKLETLIEE